MSDVASQAWIVTGGVGFIGYHLTRAMARRGMRLVVIDDFSAAPYPRAEKERNRRDLLAEFPDQLDVVVCDVSDRASLEAVFAEVPSLAGVVHLAGLAGVRPSFDDPARYGRVNVEGTTHVLELTRKAGASKFVFASSSSVYGNSTPLPAREDAPACEPESPYAASKRGAELMSAALSRRAPEMAIAALRFFTVYGPRQRPEMAITLFSRAVLAGRPIPMFGDGSMRRDFTHVDDIVRGILATIDRAQPGYRVYNLGSGNPIGLGELVTAIGDAVGARPRLEPKPVPLGDVEATFADISRAGAELDWRPNVDLARGLATVVDWVRENP